MEYLTNYVSLKSKVTMKSIILILLFGLSSALFSQSESTPVRKYRYLDKPKSEWTAGDHLMYVSKIKKQSFVIAPLLFGTGSAMMIVGAFRREYILTTIGVGVFISSIVYNAYVETTAINHIGYAGEKMNKLKFSKSGIGFNYSF
jgi:hypothetical protein